MNKHSMSKARKSCPKITIEGTKEKLTSQGGLVAVIKFLEKIGFAEVISSQMSHRRGANARYKVSDAVYLTIVGIVGGARYLSTVVSVWSDIVLRRIGGWLHIADDTTLSRIFKGLSERHIVELETVNHHLRDRVWKRALRAGKSKVAVLPNLWIDGDSTVKTD